MNPDQVIALVGGLFRTTIFVTGPLLASALLAGVAVGIIQTATQVNEGSISFLVKVCAILGVLIVLGPQLGSYVVSYTRASFEEIAQVVR